MTLTEIRHDLHAHPQIMFEETYASALVQRELTQLGIEHKTGLARGTGVLGWLPPTQSGGKTIALRADMDALPILEETGLPYASQFPGRMHACGHDGHTTILIGVARELAKQQHRPNGVLFLFQPAEEGGSGGRMLVEDGCLNGSLLGEKADFCFGLHGWTSVTVGHVATRVGSLMAATDGFTVEVTGQGGHAAMPSHTRDPIIAAAHLVTALQTLVSRNTDPFDQMVVTVAQIHGGTAQNVIPMSCTLNGTVRTMSAEVRELAERRFKEVCAGVAAAFGCEAEVRWKPGYPVVVNEASAVERFMSVTTPLLGADKVSDQAIPTMGGEDFAYYGSECPSCFFQLGLVPAGQDTYPSVHTPLFDFNDEAIEVGLKVMVGLAMS